MNYCKVNFCKLFLCTIKVNRIFFSMPGKSVYHDGFSKVCLLNPLAASYFGEKQK